MKRYMSEEGNNYTPLDIAKLPPKKKSFSLSNKMLFSLIVFLTIGVGMVGYLLVLRRPIRKAVPAYLSGEASACDVKLGPPISGSEKVEGNKYSIQVPLENKSDNKKRVKLSSGWFACPLNDQQTCTANAHKEDKELLLGKKEQKIITVTAEQPEGACGSLQIDLKLKAVKKADDDDDKDGEKKDGEAKEGEVRVESDGGGWDESCNTNSTWVGGFYAFPQACGVPPTDTPPPSTPTPTGVEPTSTPTPTDDDDNRTPTPTRTPTPSLTPTGSPGPTLTPTPTSTPGDGTPTPTPTPKPTSTPSLSNTPGPSPTPIPVACGTKSCDNTTNPC
ncbi:hypothetical protein HY612_02865, partial [Candidatus Roizmanbacteria bacterium]|nr:hypothetical protein [Candidatus Roizmanbacteria bacterium]